MTTIYGQFLCITLPFYVKKLLYIEIATTASGGIEHLAFQKALDGTCSHAASQLTSISQFFAGHSKSHLVIQ